MTFMTQVTLGGDRNSERYFHSEEGGVRTGAIGVPNETGHLTLVSTTYSESSPFKCSYVHGVKREKRETSFRSL